MRGLKKACSDLIKQVDKYYSKESALKQAKIKLLKGEVPEEHLKVNLSTILTKSLIWGIYYILFERSIL